MNARTNSRTCLRGDMRDWHTVRINIYWHTNMTSLLMSVSLSLCCFYFFHRFHPAETIDQHKILKRKNRKEKTYERGRGRCPRALFLLLPRICRNHDIRKNFNKNMNRRRRKCERGRRPCPRAPYLPLPRYVVIPVVNSVRIVTSTWEWIGEKYERGWGRHLWACGGLR